MYQECIIFYLSKFLRSSLQCWILPFIIIWSCQFCLSIPFCCCSKHLNIWFVLMPCILSACLQYSVNIVFRVRAFAVISLLVPWLLVVNQSLSLLLFSHTKCCVDLAYSLLVFVYAVGWKLASFSSHCWWKKASLGSWPLC